MAGIGFRLQKLLDEDNYTSALQAYAYSALIAAGPFLLTVMVVGLIHWVSFERLSRDEVAYFQAVIAHGFAFSLLAAGTSYLVITRYVADEYYRGHVGSFAATFFSTVFLNALVWGPPVLWYFSRLTTPWPVRIFSLLLFLFATSIWIALVFLSAARDYRRISLVFAVGAAVSFAAAYFLGRTLGLAGYIGGFALGQGAILMMLAWSIIKEFGYAEPRDYYWLHYFKKHPWLVGIGFLYNLGIWVDKFLFWGSIEGETLDVGLKHCPVYDAPLFFAYLTIVPSLAYFLVRMETDFFEKYHAYYQAIQHQDSLQRLEKRRIAILESLADNFKRMVVMQGIISGLALLAVPWLVEVTRMDPLQMGVLRTGIFAAFLQAGVLIIINLLLYFDLGKEAFITSAVFCAANAGLTALSLGMGLPAFGYGYGLACFLALITGTVLLNERLRMLHYWTFMRQPIPRPVIVQDEA